ncbi:alcohol dehydrogenase 1-like [Culicoides brevitarsis]|uniref:alcohol dehydrogenase 1-like n=1 Tax=Culicoides brevitarsis TaxID=469753 RepID=UPI00307BED55
MLSETKAIVIGGLGGIGSAICHSLLQQKVQKLAIFDIHDAITAEFVDKVTYEKCRIDQKDDLKNAFEKIWEIFGGFNLVINSAGIVNEQDVEKVFAINTIGAINFVNVAVETMRKDKKSNGGGTIVNIASTLGYLPYQGFPFYVASKHAQIGFMKSIADPAFSELTGLKFITICPGYTDTRLIGSSGINSLALRAQGEPFPPQKTTVVADCILRALGTTKTSSFWRCVNGEISEIELLTANDIQ